jgi:hypothetical protein
LNQAFAGVFGYAPEVLPQEVTAAHEAQNAERAVAIPLIAWDENLDRLKIGLLDCPDIQKRPIDGDFQSASLRHRLLERASRLCAATVIVAKHQNVTTGDFATVLNAFSGNLPIYAFNQLRNLSSEEVLAEVRASLMLPPDAHCYGAYDYDLRYYEQRTPLWDPNLRLPPASPDRFPCFFRLAESAEENRPDRITEERSLHRLAEGLDREELLRDFQKESRLRLRRAALDGLARVEREIAGQEAHLRKAVADLWEACERALKGRDGEAIMFSPEMSRSFGESIIRCAPAHIRWQLRLKVTLGKAASYIAGFPGRLAPGVARKCGDLIAFLKTATIDRFKALATQTTPEEPVTDVLARLLLNRWRNSGYAVDEGDVRKAAASIMERFRRVGLNNLTDGEWDEISGHLWAQAPKGKVALKLGFEILGSLAVLAWAAAEPMHGHLVAHIYVAHWVGGVGAAVFGGGSVITALLQKDLEQKLGPQQRARFLGIACDELGLPRLFPSGAELEEATIPPEVNLGGICARKFGLRWDKLDAGAVERLRREIEKIPA